MSQKKLSKTDNLWQKIESLNWVTDPDIERINKLFLSLPAQEQTELSDFLCKMTNRLYKKLMNQWPAGVFYSNDGTYYALNEVVGRGKDFYNAMTIEDLVGMVTKNKYTECFSYCFLPDNA